MGDVAQFLAVLLSVAGVGTVGYIVIRLSTVLISRLDGRGAPNSELLAEVDDLRARLHELEGDKQRLLELEERLDFAERMLAQRPEAARLEHGGNAE